MQKFKTIIILMLVVIFLVAGVFWYGWHFGKLSVENTGKPLNVSSRLILDRITSQYFLVTKTVFIDSQAEIETPKTNGWKDLFVGTKITVSGLIRIDVGVDAKNLAEKDIAVDTREKTITISLPPAAILDSSLYGGFEIREDKAVIDKIKSLFKDTSNEDYNRALEMLRTQATDQILADSRIFSEARADSMKLVELIVTSAFKDYRVIVK